MILSRVALKKFLSSYVLSKKEVDINTSECVDQLINEYVNILPDCCLFRSWNLMRCVQYIIDSHKLNEQQLEDLYLVEDYYRYIWCWDKLVDYLNEYQ